MPEFKAEGRRSDQPLVFSTFNDANSEVQEVAYDVSRMPKYPTIWDGFRGRRRGPSWCMLEALMSPDNTRTCTTKHQLASSDNSFVNRHLNYSRIRNTDKTSLASNCTGLLFPASDDKLPFGKSIVNKQYVSNHQDCQNWALKSKNVLGHDYWRWCAFVFHV